VAGPTGADGYGSLELTTNVQPKQNYFHATNTPLSGINGLGYKVDVTAGVPASYQLQVLGVTRTDSTSTFTSLVWEPAYNGQVNGPNGGFVTESNLENGVWWSSHPILGADGSDYAHTYVSLQSIINANPGATIVAYGVNVGSGTPNATSYVDDVSFQSQVTNFETDPPAAPTGLYFTRTGSATPIACGSAVNSYAGMTLHWTAPSGDLNQYAVTPSYPDSHGQYTYYPAGNATAVWIGDNFGHHGDGTYTYSIKAQNTAKQWSTTATTCTLIYDSTAPVVSVTPPAGSLLSGTDVTFTITVKDANLDTTNHATWVYIYGNGNGSAGHPDWHSSYGAKVDLSSGTGTFTVNTKNLPDGTYNLDVGKLYDAAGNASGVGDTYFSNYVIDNTAPSVPTLISPVNRGYTKTNDFYFKWNASTDANPGVTYELIASQDQSALNNAVATGNVSGVWDSVRDGAGSGQYPLTTPTDHSTGAGNGTWYWAVRAIDAAGNKSGWSSVWHVTIDTQLPSGSITSPTNGGYVNTRDFSNVLTVKGSASDNLGLNRVLVQLLTSKHGAIQNNTVYLSGTSTNWQSTFNTKSLGLSDGQYSLVASFDDNAGNVYKTAYVDFTLDNTKPVAAFTSGTSDPTPNGYYNGNFTVGYDVSDNFMLKDVDVSLFDTDASHSNHWAAGCYSNSTETTADDQGTCTVQISNKTLAQLPDGTYYVAIQGKDAAGNYTVAAKRYVTIDRTGPSVTISSAKQASKNKVTFKGSVSDTNLKYYYCYLTTDQTVTYKGKTYTPGEEVGVRDAHCQTTWAAGQTSFSGKLGGFNIAGLPTGSYTVNLVAYDLAGNNNAASPAMFVVTIDHTAPTGLANQSPADGTHITTANLTSIGWTTASDPHGPVTYYYESTASSATHTNGSFVSPVYQSSALSTNSISTLNTPEGTYYWHVKACDALGNCTVWTSPWQIVVDNTAPAVPTNLGWNDANNVTVADNGYTNQYSGTAVWQDSSNDVDHYVYKYWNDIAGDPYNSEANAYTATTTATSLAGVFNRGEGVHHFCVEAVDAAGNTSACSAAFTITYDKTAPAVTITSYGQSGNVIQPNVTATDTSPLSYSWTTDPNVVISNTSALNPTFTVNKDGSYTFQLTVTDAAGNATTVPFTFTYTTPASNPSTTNGFTPVATTTNGGGTPTTTPLTDNGTGTTTPQVKGDSTVKPQVKGASTVNLKNASDKNGGSNFLGLGWWWLLIIAAILLGLWWLIAARHRADDQE
jgi:hypothetical protein